MGLLSTRESRTGIATRSIRALDRPGDRQWRTEGARRGPGVPSMQSFIREPRNGAVEHIAGPAAASAPGLATRSGCAPGATPSLDPLANAAFRVILPLIESRREFAVGHSLRLSYDCRRQHRCRQSRCALRSFARNSAFALIAVMTDNQGLSIRISQGLENPT